MDIIDTRDFSNSEDGSGLGSDDDSANDSANDNDADKDEENEDRVVIDEEKHQLRLQNDWIARSLTSIAPRYHAKTGECSIYSCLAQFSAPELMTGQNKWACDKCTRLHQARITIK